MRFLIELGLVGALFAVTLLFQREHLAELRKESDLLSLQTASLSQAQEQNRRLHGAAIDPKELERLRSDHAAIARLHAEIASLQAVESALPLNPLAQKPEQEMLEALTQEERVLIYQQGATISKGWKPRDVWHNAGKKTAGAALETVFWSASVSDMETLVSVIEFDPSVRKRAEQIMAALPAALSDQYGTPEQLFSGSLVKHIGAVAAVQVDSVAGTPGTAKSVLPPYCTVSIMVQAAPTVAGESPLIPLIEFELRYHPDGWRMVVPFAAIEEYSRLVSGGMTP
ncbi:MAG: hypothetical protein RIS56_1215 [Verrucomicrobiota bacterium]|jgi:hypothetical protein